MLFLVLPGVCGFAQYLERSVIAAGGQYQESVDGHSLSWTIGELATTYLANGFTIQQGFQQGESNPMVGLSRSTIPSAAWRVFPNPTTEFLHLETNFEEPWRFELQDVLGRSLFLGTSVVAHQRFALPLLKSGVYLITIHDLKGRRASKKIFVNQN